VATPHSHHFEHVKQCLDAGKNVLCEKPLTVNARQARALVEIAKQKHLFFMEAVWTRFFPISVSVLLGGAVLCHVSQLIPSQVAVRKHIADGAIGEVLRGTADLSHVLKEPEWDPKRRLMNPELAGGCLMDIGPYPILWLMQKMWHTLPKEYQAEKPSVAGASMTKDTRTGVNTMTAVLLEFPRSTPSGESKAQAVATAGFRVSSDPDGDNTAGSAVRLYGTKGELQVFSPIYRPEKYRILLHSGQVTEEKIKVPCDAYGMFWEADEAARCLRDGKLESDGIPWEESVLVTELLDEARKQGGLTYPKHVDPVE
jgi:predicted dehydrogenase